MTKVLGTLSSLALALAGCGGGGGSDAPDVDAGSGSGSGDDAGSDTTCNCHVGQACDANNECVYADTLMFTIDESVYQSSDTLDRTASITACTYHASEFSATPPTPAAEEGSCKVYTGNGAGPGSLETFQGDAGTVSIKTSLLGMTALATPSGENSCYYKDLGSTTDVFSAGEQITFSATGGAHIAAFSDDVAAPMAVSTSISTITRGSAIPLTWTADSSSTNFFILVSTQNDGGDYAYIQCTPPDNGSYTIPSALTSYLRQDSTYTALYLQRGNAALVQPTGSMVSVDLITQSTYVALPTYNP